MVKEIKFDEFQKIYLMTIASKLEQCEKARQECLNEYKSMRNFHRNLSLFGVFILILFSIPFLFLKSLAVYIFLGFVYIFIFIFLFQDRLIKHYCKKYQTILKENLMENILTSFGNIKWHKEGSKENTEFKNMLNDKQLDKSALFPELYFDYDDIFSGNYNKTDFIIYEKCMFNSVHSSDKEKEPLKGLIILLKRNHKTEYPTIVVSKGDFSKKYADVRSIFRVIPFVLFFALFYIAIGTSIIQDFSINSLVALAIISAMAYAVFFGTIKNYKKLKKENKLLNTVLLEDVKFNKRFNVYSDNQIEARCLLTPAFMEKFYNLKIAFDAKNVKCSFYENKLMISIETNKDLFELGDINKPVKQSDNIYQFYRELKSIYNIIDSLESSLES